MYKSTVRALVRHGFAKMNAGDPSFLLRLAAPDVVLCFPGDNSWSQMFRPVDKGRHPHETHIGIDECKAFADRFVEHGVQFQIEDILVNGPPWKLRVAVRAHDFVVRAGGGDDDYNNRAVAFLELRWGRLVRWEDYEDCERVTAWDAQRISAELRASPPVQSVGSAPR
jgi:ketosteroid isomerase-like protein